MPGPPRGSGPALPW
uniref:Uncharacterized protein n=1 Tax=Arundo donax TaxID=35708 RepID=A0A0A8XR76_ARUDO